PISEGPKRWEWRRDRSAASISRPLRHQTCRLEKCLHPRTTPGAMSFWQRAATADPQPVAFSVSILELAYEELDAPPRVPNLPRSMLHRRRRRHEHRIARLFGTEGER